MIVINTFQISAQDDQELNIKREGPLTYHLAYDDTQQPNGIIFSIPGFGADANINYQLHLIEHIAKTYNLIAICVEYHCFFSRIRNGASYGFNSFDTEIFLDIIKRYKIQLDPNHLDFESVVDKLDQYVTNEKVKDPSFKDYRENIFATILPKKNEYQNFGILQTIDILTVLYDLKAHGYEQLIETKPLFAFGSSHGAYLTNLLMKFAPNTFDAILENSAYVKPPLVYIVGQEFNSKNPETYLHYKNSIFIHAFTLTYWTLKKESPNYFTQSAFEIRDLSDKQQLDQFLQYRSKTKLISYHSINDDIAIYDEKKEYIKVLKDNSLEIEFVTIKSEKQVDGKLIKNTDHSMGMSNKEFLKKHLPTLLDKYQASTKTDACLQNIISYKTSENISYNFSYQKDGLKIEIKNPSLSTWV